jgi:hypothetical protein
MALSIAILLGLKMCWKIERYYSRCGHWATPVIETFCAKGFSNGWACGDSQVNAESVPQRDGPCPRCVYRDDRKLPGVAFTHRFSGGGPSVPFSRNSLNAKPLAMAKEEREKLAQEAAETRCLVLSYKTPGGWRQRRLIGNFGWNKRG